MDCPKCKAQIDNDSLFCDQCGQEIKYCSSCGKPGKGNRCTACGSLMIAASQQAPSTISPIQNTVSSDATSVGGDKTVRVTPPAQLKAPGLFLVNESAGITIEAVDGAVIGRKAGNYMQVFATQPYVSGTHASFHFQSGVGWSIKDLGSSNGTFINGRQQPENIPCLITNGMRIQIANIEFVAQLI